MSQVSSILGSLDLVKQKLIFNEINQFKNLRLPDDFSVMEQPFEQIARQNLVAVENSIVGTNFLWVEFLSAIFSTPHGRRFANPTHANVRDSSCKLQQNDC
jgi:hypothetical protein